MLRRDHYQEDRHVNVVRQLETVHGAGRVRAIRVTYRTIPFERRGRLHERAQELQKKYIMHQYSVVALGERVQAMMEAAQSDRKAHDS